MLPMLPAPIKPIFILLSLLRHTIYIPVYEHGFGRHSVFNYMRVAEGYEWQWRE
jgi:hypothetical protein